MSGTITNIYDQETALAIKDILQSEEFAEEASDLIDFLVTLEEDFGFDPEQSLMRQNRFDLTITTEPAAKQQAEQKRGRLFERLKAKGIIDCQD